MFRIKNRNGQSVYFDRITGAPFPLDGRSLFRISVTFYLKLYNANPFNLSLYSKSENRYWQDKKSEIFPTLFSLRAALWHV